jgi:hypothetical protein
MKLYVKIKRRTKVKDFIADLFTYGISKDAIKDRVILKVMVPSYYDKKLTKEQCGIVSYRSFDDLLLIVKTYYPSYTAKKLIKLLFSFNIYERTFYMVTCYGIRKPTCCFYKVSEKNYVIGDRIIKSKATNGDWKDILKLIDITTKKQLQKLVKSIK